MIANTGLREPASLSTNIFNNFIKNPANGLPAANSETVTILRNLTGQLFPMETAGKISSM